jgi:hypothetical protein
LPKGTGYHAIRETIAGLAVFVVQENLAENCELAKPKQYTWNGDKKAAMMTNEASIFGATQCFHVLVQRREGKLFECLKAFVLHTEQPELKYSYTGSNENDRDHEGELKYTGSNAWIALERLVSWSICVNVS